MKKYLKIIMFPIIFLAGLSLLLYPLVSNEWNDYRQSRLISTYDEAVAEQTAAGAIDYNEEWTQAFGYNDALKPYILPDSFAKAQWSDDPDETYMSCLNLTGDGMMGYVQIPKINVKLPIYHTVGEKVLQTAAGHLEGSSLPVGGEGNHAVISAHRGLPSASLFTDLDQLKEGDCFLLYILDDVLCYKVDQVSVVEPEDTSDLAAVEGKDLVTLLTCTPYGVNSHRLLVRGYRVPYEELGDDAVAASAYQGGSLHTNYLLWVFVGLGVTGAFILLMFLYDRRSRRVAAVGVSQTGSAGTEAPEPGSTGERAESAAEDKAESQDPEA